MLVQAAAGQGLETDQPEEPAALRSSRTGRNAAPG